MALSRDDLINSKDLQVVSVDVPEWGGSVNISVMSGSAREKFEQSVVAKHGKPVENVRAKLLSLCLVDDNGNLLFHKKDEKGALIYIEKDVEELGKKSSTILDRLFDVAFKLNGIGNSEVEKQAKN